LIHPALGESYTSSILQIHGRDDDHDEIPNVKCKILMLILNFAAIILK
jgi:hypothetical protein